MLDAENRRKLNTDYINRYGKKFKKWSWHNDQPKKLPKLWNYFWLPYRDNGNNFRVPQIALDPVCPPASKASREVANLTERKNPHTLLYGVKEWLFDFSSNQNQKPIEKMFSRLAARAVFVSLLFFKNS